MNLPAHPHRRWISSLRYAITRREKFPRSGVAARPQRIGAVKIRKRSRERMKKSVKHSPRFFDRWRSRSWLLKTFQMIYRAVKFCISKSNAAAAGGGEQAK